MFKNLFNKVFNKVKSVDPKEVQAFFEEIFGKIKDEIANIQNEQLSLEDKIIIVTEAVVDNSNFIDIPVIPEFIEDKVFMAIIKVIVIFAFDLIEQEKQ